MLIAKVNRGENACVRDVLSEKNVDHRKNRPNHSRDGGTTTERQRIGFRGQKREVMTDSLSI
jgi:hypothetical protein